MFKNLAGFYRKVEERLRLLGIDARLASQYEASADFILSKGSRA